MPRELDEVPVAKASELINGTRLEWAEFVESDDGSSYVVLYFPNAHVYADSPTVYGKALDDGASGDGEIGPDSEPDELRAALTYHGQRLAAISNELLNDDQAFAAMKIDDGLDEIDEAIAALNPEED